MYLFRNTTTKLPAYACLYSQHDIVHIEFARPSGMFCIDGRVRKDLSGISVRKFEKLVENAWLRVVYIRI